MSPKRSDIHRANRKAQILSAAISVFQEKGYNQTTIQDIIEASEISRGGIYTYFRNTEDIFLAILNNRDTEDFEQQMLDTEMSCWERLSTQFDSYYLRVLKIARSLIKPIFEYYFTAGWGQEKNTSMLSSRFDKAYKLYTNLIEEGIRKGEFYPVLPASSIARTIISFMDGLNLSMLLFGDQQAQPHEQVRAFKVYMHQILIPQKNEQISYEKL